MGAAPTCRCCAEEVEPAPYYDNTSQDGMHTQEEEVVRHVSWPIEFKRIADNEGGFSGGRPRRSQSNFSTRSAMSAATAAAGEAAKMSFLPMPGQFEFNAEEFRKIARLQKDGCIIIAGNYPPLMVTKTGHPGVLAGDTIVEVLKENPELEADPLRRLEAALSGLRRFHLSVTTRPLKFEIDLRCEGEHWFKLGVLVTIERQHADRIKVQSVFDTGLIPVWNRENPQCQVLPGDWIIHVNGEAGNAQDMARNLSGCEKGDELWLGLQTRPRIMDSALHQSVSYTSKAKIPPCPTNAPDVPDILRVKTGDWEQMKDDFHSSHKLQSWK